MKQLPSFFLVLALIGWAGTGTSFGAQQTWIGYISDSQCGADHGGEVDVRECTLKCTKSGDKYVLVAERGSKILPIANQSFAALPEHAGHEVKVTGELSGDAITISKIEM